MGILGYFRNRQARESALGSAEEQAAIEEAVAQAKAESARLQEEHEQAGNGGAVGGLAGLGVLFSQLQAAQAAGVNVEAAGLTADLRGSDLREEILGVIAAHGLDATQDGQAIDASLAGALQSDILAVLARAGIDVNAAAAGMPFAIRPSRRAGRAGRGARPVGAADPQPAQARFRAKQLGRGRGRQGVHAARTPACASVAREGCRRDRSRRRD